MPQPLSAERRARAATFLITHARPLERALYRYYFESGPPETVLAELAAYQNPDGGFGSALEPDLRVSDSSVIATTVALQTLRALATPADHPLVTGACAYLRDTYDARHGVWPIIPPNVDDAPHAPWWTYRDDPAAWLLNPRAEIAGYLCDYAQHFPPEMCKTVMDAVVAHLLTLREIEMHELLCVLRLFETPALPQGTRARIEDRLADLLRITVERDPARWSSYNLQPLDVVPRPDAPFADLFADILNANLAVRIDQQRDDGSWTTPATWGDLYPDTWPQAAREWSSILTLQYLRVLDAFGLLE